jgi:hypothetical protein
MYEFIILRHISKKEHQQYILKCFISIKKFYPNHKVTILDDKSDTSLIKNIDEYLIKDKSINIIYNTYECSLAEFLPYYYLSKIDTINKYVIVHDSTYFNKYYDFSNVNNKFLFHFRNHSWDDINQETNLIKYFNNSKKAISLYMKQKDWCGMFGCMCVVQSNLIKEIYEKYNLETLLKKIDNRKKRMCLERIMGLLFFSEELVTVDNCSIFGDYYGDSFNEPRNEEYLTKIGISR